MINNRQGGRRRGRGGQRPQGMQGNSGGNARDNRQRGNAAQLLEKYKNLARDAQLAGDRVQTEYYLQYADHYFRVLEEHRSRYEEQNAQRRRRDDDDDDTDGDDEVTVEADGDDDGETEVRQRPRGRDRGDRGDRPQRQRSNGSHHADADSADERIEVAALPPAIGATSDDDEEEEAPKPRRRTRKPKAEGDDATA